MIFYGEKNVYEAALDRFRFIFNEFYGKRPIVVTISGGKDSTVCLYLVKEIMDEMGIEKIPVLFLDQEAETPMTVEYIRYIMHLPWVEPYWVQSFFQEWNASKGDWFNVWGPGEQWCREKEPGNPYADLDLKVHQYFTHTLACAQKTLFGKSFVSIGGVRIEESPARLSGLTHGEVYEGITWVVVEVTTRMAHLVAWFSTLFGIGKFMMFGIISSARRYHTTNSITMNLPRNR